MADILPLIPETSLVPSVEETQLDGINQFLSSSDDEGNGVDERTKEITYGPLGLVDEENILVLPPEDYGEISDVERTRLPIKTDKTKDCLHSEISRANSIINRETNSTVSSRGKKKRKKKIYTVNLSNCKYESVRRVMRRFGFREVEEDEEWNLYWTDFSVSIDRVVVMKTWQKINHFPGMTELCRKDSLARNLNRMLKLFPKEYNIFPKTWCLPSDWNELQNYARKHKTRTYIFKPDAGCQGKGIYITRSFKDVRPMENMICQVYVTKPFLIDGYKFDIRLYVLLTSCDPLRLYVFRDGLVRFTTIPYAEPNQRNMHNMYMHLTNYAVQKHSEGFIRDDEEAGTKRRLTTLNRWFKQNGYDLQKIWSDVDDVVIKTVLSGYAVLRHHYRTCFPNHVQTSACFEILGFDIMFNHKLKPYVLEVNHSPSFTTDSKLDREIKEAMLYDTLNLAHFGMLSKRKCMEDERKRIRNRLLQKAGKKDLKDATEKEQARYLAINERYEKNHMGNFRLIYPSADVHKYDQFLSPGASFYTETMTYKVRSECARQQREEIRQKQEKVDMYLNKNKTAMPPESPTSRKSTAVKSNQNLNSKRRTSSRIVSGDSAEIKNHTKQQTDSQTNECLSGEQTPSTSPKLTNSNSSAEVKKPVNDVEASWVAQPILANEEAERLGGLRQRKRLMKSIGLIDAIHKLLGNSRGVCSVVSSTTASETKSLQSLHLAEDTDEMKSDQTVTANPNLFRSKRPRSSSRFKQKSPLYKPFASAQTIRLHNLNEATNQLTNNLDTLGQKRNTSNSTDVGLISVSQLSTAGRQLQALPSRSFRRNRSATQLKLVPATGISNNTSVTFGTGSLNGASPKLPTTNLYLSNPSKSVFIPQNTFYRAMPASEGTHIVYSFPNSIPGTEFEPTFNPYKYAYTPDGMPRRPTNLSQRDRHSVVERNFPARSAFPAFRGLRTSPTNHRGRSKLACLEFHTSSLNMLDQFNSNNNNNADNQAQTGQRICSHGTHRNQTLLSKDSPEKNQLSEQQTLQLTGSTFYPNDSFVRQLTGSVQLKDCSYPVASPSQPTRAM